MPLTCGNVEPAGRMVSYAAVDCSLPLLSAVANIAALQFRSTCCSVLRIKRTCGRGGLSAEPPRSVSPGMRAAVRIGRLRSRWSVEADLAVGRQRCLYLRPEPHKHGGDAPPLDTEPVTNEIVSGFGVEPRGLRRKHDIKRRQVGEP